MLYPLHHGPILLQGYPRHVKGFNFLRLAVFIFGFSHNFRLKLIYNIQPLPLCYNIKHWQILNMELMAISTLKEWNKQKWAAKNILPTLFQCLYLLIMLVFVGSITFANNIYVSLYGAAALGIFLFVGYHFAKLANKLSKRQFIIVVCVLLALFLGFNFFVTNSFLYGLPPDTDIIYKSVADLMPDGRLNAINNDLPIYYTDMKLEANSDYFCMFPNNIAQLLTMYFIFLLAKPFGIQPVTPEGQIWAVGASSLVMTATVVFICLIVHRLFRSNSATLLSLLLCAICPTFYYSVPNFYTDTYILLPTMAALYFFIVFIDKGLYRYALISTVLFTWASLVKITSIIVLIAIVLYYWFTCSSVGAKKKLLIILSLAAVVLLLRFLFTLWYTNSPMFDFSRSDELNMPISFWFCFGSSGLGTINNPDRHFAISITDPELRSKLLWERAFNNYSQYSLPELFALWHRKLIWTWNDGLYEGGIYAQASLRENWSATFVKPHRGGFFLVYWFSQGHMMMLYLASAVSGAVSLLRKKLDYAFFINLGIFGFVLYLQIFETAPRRAIIALPLFIFNLVYLHYITRQEDIKARFASVWKKRQKHSA